MVETTTSWSSLAPVHSCIDLTDKAPQDECIQRLTQVANSISNKQDVPVSELLHTITAVCVHCSPQSTSMLLSQGCSTLASSTHQGQPDPATVQVRQPPNTHRITHTIPATAPATSRARPPTRRPAACQSWLRAARCSRSSRCISHPSRGPSFQCSVRCTPSKPATSKETCVFACT